MTSPSLLSRESTTLSPRWAQNGHFIALILSAPRRASLRIPPRSSPSWTTKPEPEHDGTAQTRWRAARWPRRPPDRWGRRRTRSAPSERFVNPPTPPGVGTDTPTTSIAIIRNEPRERHVDAERVGDGPDAAQSRATTETTSSNADEQPPGRAHHGESLGKPQQPAREHVRRCARAAHVRACRPTGRPRSGSPAATNISRGRASATRADDQRPDPDGQ